MTQTEYQTAPRLQGMLSGFPRDVLPGAAGDALARFCIDLDVVGRLHAETGEPMIDEHTLRGLLRPALGEELAADLVGMLHSLPEHHLRLPVADDEHPDEPSWFELAERIVIYDTEPESSFGQLNIPWRQAGEDVVAAVHDAFPSLEEEMLDAAIVPPRIMALLEPQSRGEFHDKLIECDRQLGWWAALVAVLLVPLAQMASETERENTWPLGMFALAAGVGGWTLTVVESIILSPTD